MKTRIYTLTTLFAVLFCTGLLAQDSRIWSTYYGSAGNEGGFTTATDASGNVFMAGITGSISGIASGGFQNTFGGGNVDAFLVKFDSTGTRLWGTYYGGPSDEMTFFGGKIGIATDAFGNVYLAGLTSSTSGIASGGFQNTIGGTMNAYLVKFDASGNRVWATYYGGTNGYGYNVATDVWGNVYLAGTTGSSSDVALGGFQNTIGGISDAFLVKFDSAGNRIWATYYGGANVDEGYSVATDASGNVFLGGYTSSTSGIASGGFQNTYGGGSNDAFLVKFDSAGARLWATYYGGSGDEMMLFAGDIGVATDVSGNTYLTGLTTSTANMASGGFQNTYGGGSSDAFLVKFDDAGTRLWATYYGGNGNDRGYSVATNTSGSSFLAGRTDSPGNIASGGFQNTFGGSNDPFLAKFDAAGNRLCATYYGGVGEDNSNSAATDLFGNVYLAGGTENTSGIASGGFQNFYGGGTFDAMLVKFNSSCIATQIDDVSFTDNITVFPNPSNGKFMVEGIQENSTLKIYNLLGECVFQSADYKSHSLIDFSPMPDGVYSLQTKSTHATSTTKLILNKQ